MSKLITFIGRLEEDTGLSVYLKVVKGEEFKSLKFKIQFIGEGRLRKRAEKQGRVRGVVKDLQLEIKKSRFIFTSGYLAILEAMASQRLVFSVYDHPLKKDYLEMSPLADKMVISASADELVKQLKDYLRHPEKEKEVIDKAYQWVKKQTWERVADLYEKLWQKSLSSPR